MARRIVNDVLNAIASGKLSTEDALRAAMKGRRALADRLEHAAKGGLCRPTIYKYPTYPAAVPEIAVERVKRRFGRSRNVRSVHWGVRQWHGQRTGQRAVVVHVVRKVSRARLRKERRRVIPAAVVVRHKHRRYEIPIDVQAVGPSATLHIAFVRPGHHAQIRLGVNGIGALGGVVDGSGGQLFAVTAGHVARAIGTREVDCADAEAGVFALGKVKCERLNQGDDVAVIGPIASVPRGATIAPTFARDARDADLQQRVFVLLPRAITPIESHIEGVGVSAVFGSDGQLLSLVGLTSIDRVTQGGDSGAPVLDAQGSVIGFVVGADATRTFLMPARRALDAVQNCV
jgi:hypothetical protein